MYSPFKSLLAEPTVLLRAAPEAQGGKVFPPVQLLSNSMALTLMLAPGFLAACPLAGLPLCLAPFPQLASPVLGRILVPSPEFHCRLLRRGCARVCRQDNVRQYPHSHCHDDQQY